MATLTSDQVMTAADELDRRVRGHRHGRVLCLLHT